ncbi:MAG TPA: hypothetical protein VJT73_17150, partial [Polyangiaceae bacterium]|nr:hypothetical protein [Polyangiaceae bacterium]
MNGDDLMKLGVEALRERFDGHTDDAALARRRLLAAAAQRKRSRALKLAIWLPLAAAFVGITAWAGATGRIASALHAITYAVMPAERSTTETTAPSSPRDRSSRGTATALAEAAPPPSEPEVAPPPSEPEVTPEPEVAPSAPEHPRAAIALPAHSGDRRTDLATGTPAHRPAAADEHPRQDGERAPESAPAPPAIPADPSEAIYLAAHEAHFRKSDFAGALAAWDRYLVTAPQGRFAPEARWNRAIALFKLGRRRDGIDALKPFAAGTYGSYRRAEAERLIEAAAQA